MALFEVGPLTVHRGGRATLDGAGLSCGTGEIVGVIGPNGAGKTTLLDAACGTAPATGPVVLDGRRLEVLTPDARARRGLGRTFQEPRLPVGVSVADALLTGCHARMRTGLLRDLLRLPASATAERAAQREVARVSALLELGTLMDLDCAGLSLGAARLVELGRALCAAPRVLLLDEPFSGTDAAEAEVLAAVLRRLRDEGMGIVLVEHDVDVVLSLCDFLHVLDAGKPIARGRPGTVRHDPAVVAAWLGTQEADRVAVGV